MFNEKQKRITIILMIIMMCFISYQGFAGGNKDRSNERDRDRGRNRNRNAVVQQEEIIIPDTFFMFNEPFNMDLLFEQLMEPAYDEQENNLTIIDAPAADAPIEQAAPPAAAVTAVAAETPVQTAQVTGRSRMSVTDEIVERLSLTELFTLTYFVSRSFPFIAEGQSGSVNFVTSNGQLIISNDIELQKTFVFQENDTGQLRARRNDFLDIVFRPEGTEVILTFRKVSQLYILDSINFDNRSHPISSAEGEPIRLLVSGQDQRIVRTGSAPSNQQSNQQQNQQLNPSPSSQAATAQQQATTPQATQQPQQQQQQAQQPAPSQQQQNTGSNIERTTNHDRLLILSSGTLTENDVLRYLGGRNINEAQVRRLVRLYIEEAAFEGINHDIAIAQLIFATQFLTNRTLMTDHNYAGFTRTDSVWNGSQWNGKFADERQGVRSHVQHLKHYSAGSLERVNGNVNPRFSVLRTRGYLGNVKTLGELYRHWVNRNSDSYRNSINNILNGLYQQ
ncbi:MAG: glucosaminidase domain-containing protein [Treponema sp.]|nr:glucosaminidase domain-containing protein [Treponema sp.]